MKTQPSRWSPADLDRQRLVVRRIALRTDQDLRQLAAARHRFVADVHSTLGGPLALFICFVAGALVGPHAPARTRADTPHRPRGWLAPAGALGTLVQRAPAYGALYRWLVAFF